MEDMWRVRHGSARRCEGYEVCSDVIPRAQ